MKSNANKYRGFTLIELLVVIAIAVVLAALVISVANIMVRQSIIDHTLSERDQLNTAIQAYYSKYKFYPPSNGTAGNYQVNQLYYELLGATQTTNTGGLAFVTLDNASTISAATFVSAFGVGGIMNCSKGDGEDSQPALTFLPGLKSGEIATESNSSGSWNIIVTAANSDPTYQPLPGVYSQAGRPANPWCYLCPGTHNLSSYDLWVQISIGGKNYLICNWLKNAEVQP